MQLHVKKFPVFVNEHVPLLKHGFESHTAVKIKYKLRNLKYHFSNDNLISLTKFV